MVKWIKNTKAFTFIEVMVVVVIFAILLAIAIPNFISYLEKSNEKQQIEQIEKKKGTHQGVY